MVGPVAVANLPKMLPNHYHYCSMVGAVLLSHQGLLLKCGHNVLTNRVAMLRGGGGDNILLIPVYSIPPQIVDSPSNKIILSSFWREVSFWEEGGLKAFRVLATK